MYTSRANVASIQVGDIIYKFRINKCLEWWIKWYGVTNVNGHYPNLDSGYALLINSLGVVDAIVNCTPTPTPTPLQQQ